MLNLNEKDQKIKNTIFLLLTILPIAIIVSPGISESIIILICLLFLTNNFLKNDWSFLNEKIIKYLLIIYGFLLINLLLSQNFYFSFLRNFLFIKYIILIAAIKYSIDDKNKFNKLILFWSIIVIFSSADLYYQWFFKKDIFGFQDRDPLRLNGFFRKENANTFISSFLFVSIFFWFKKKNKTIKELTLIFATISLVVLICFASGSRALFVRLIFSILLILILFKFNLKNKIIIFSCLLLLFLIPLTLSKNLKTRYIYQLFNSDREFNVKTLKNNFVNHSLHYGHYLTAYKIFIDNKWFGVGTKNFRIFCAEEKYSTKNLQSYKQCSTHPHQIYLELLAEQGIIGSSVILIFIFFIFINFYNYYQKSKNYLILFPLSFLISHFLPLVPSASFFANSFQTLFWIVFGFAYLLYNNRVFNK
jgi:O-antigen ligase